MRGLSEHSSDSRDAVGDVEKEDVLEVLRIVNARDVAVHFRQAGQKIEALGLDHDGIAGNLDVLGGTDRDNAIPRNHHGLISQDAIRIHGQHVNALKGIALGLLGGGDREEQQRRNDEVAKHGFSLEVVCCFQVPELFPFLLPNVHLRP